MRDYMTTKTNQLPAWQALEAHYEQIADQRMQDWFANDPARFSQFSLQVGELFLDYSKNRIQPETIQRLCALAEAVQLRPKIEALFTGLAVNTSENRPALHTALRDPSGTPLLVNGNNIKPLIRDNLEKMRVFVQRVQQQKWLGCTGKPLRDIVNIGIGGSHLGPLLATCGLSHFAQPGLRCHFISNIDTAHIQEVLNQINPEETLIIISSKSFTTLETTTNANAIKTWLENKLGHKNLKQHFVAITAATDKAIAFGIPAQQIFPLWDWIGGRYSICSAIGLPLALLIGMDHFEEFLRGAQEMDEHFRHAEFSQNMPVLMGLLGIWYINFFAANNQAIVPYTHLLSHLRTYLQQADMESNGKNMSRHGELLDYATGPIIWGEQGCNAQHAFHQLLHQGTHFIPVDFILVGRNKKDLNDSTTHQDILVASGLSQAQALLQGKPYQQALEEALAEGLQDKNAHALAQHKTIPGNRPSNLLFLNELTPRNLGALLALYEHKIYVQGVIWNINSFDQWGVELGKQLLPKILADLQNPLGAMAHDSSTQGLIEYYKNL
jgi:glucose-6-phosphate isomerase